MKVFATIKSPLLVHPVMPLKLHIHQSARGCLCRREVICYDAPIYVLVEGLRIGTLGCFCNFWAYGRYGSECQQ